HLIDLQLKVFAADRELSAYTGDDPEPLRETMRQAAAAKNHALRPAGRPKGPVALRDLDVVRGPALVDVDRLDSPDLDVQSG
ncbi:hypothetical protein KBZ21_40260, partial [Streptomyces sp. A73]|nr:hypothetical protein [Streptomyces sp. A73]